MPKKHNEYPHLVNRRRSYPHLKDSPLSRRSRLLSKALLRSTRRWDLYCDLVRRFKLDGDESAGLEEWRLIKQNAELLEGLRKISSKTLERNERLAKARVDHIRVPEVFVPKSSHQEGFSLYGE